ncbi:MAG: hypothetical protein K6T78_09875 [Alicyclobacillus sp.]|nr:hypothetical protein [Alicyclobacillus sp.]
MLRWTDEETGDAILDVVSSVGARILYDTPHTTHTFIAAIRDLTQSAFHPFAEPAFPK